MLFAEEKKGSVIGWKLEFSSLVNFCLLICYLIRCCIMYISLVSSFCGGLVNLSRSLAKSKQ